MPELRLALDGRSAAATPTGKDRDEEQHQEYYKEHLGDPRSSARDAAESQDARNEGDHEKDDGIVEHGFVGVWGFRFGDFLGKGPVVERRVGVLMKADEMAPRASL